MVKKQNEVVVHHNYLNESVFNFNELELNLFIVMMYKMRAEKENTVIFKAGDIKSLIRSKDRSYAKFEEIINNLQDRTIYLKTENGYKRIKPFPTLDFNLKNKTIEVEINSSLIPLIKELKEQFTQYSLREYLSLKSKYSKRIFQLLKQYEKIGKRTFNLNDLKELLDCGESYHKFSNFEARVLKTTKNDINEKTSLEIDYVKIKSGVNISKIEFSISNKTTKNDIFLEETKENRKEIIERTLNTFGVKYIKDLTDRQKKILNATLKISGYKSIVE